MDLSTLDTTTMFDVFLLLLIGVGPKIVLVPDLHVTAESWY
jgi:hypothetical protein